MKIRITGTKQETAAAVKLLPLVFDVRETSGFHPNRGNSTLGRVYVEAVERESVEEIVGRLVDSDPPPADLAARVNERRNET